MEWIRKIIKEELETLWGRPIPRKGEKGYKPYKHNLEVVHTTASHYKSVSITLDNSIDDIENIVGLTGIDPQERFNQILNIIARTRKVAQQLEQEYNRDLKNIR